MTDLLKRLLELAPRALARMYQPDERLFVFRVRRTRRGLVAEGLSRRYTAIALIGLAGEEDAIASTVLGVHTLHDVCGRLVGDIWRVDNLGDVSLILWAARAVDYPDRRWVWDRLRELCPADGSYPVAELAWTLIALCVDREAPLADVRESVARRLISSFEGQSGMFPHAVGGNGARLRAHVSCFADLVYPIHALTHYFTLAGDHQARDVALQCARQICWQQGPAGQWWWHYDRRTGDVIERYPVYAVHQDAMAPMALCALQDATGVDFSREVGLGLAWLGQAPELGGGSLIDPEAGVVWRKVARREPRKLARYLQAVASRIHSSLRVPGLDLVLPSGAVDYEDRPYHLGWLLYAWRPSRGSAMEAGGVGRISPVAPGAPVRGLFGVPFSALTLPEALERIAETIARRGRLHIGVVNAAKIVNMRRNEVLRQAVLRSDLILADGMSIVWASRLLGRPLPERVPGIDLMLGMLRRGNEQRYRVYCLGATDEILDRAATRIAADYPNVELVGRHNGYFGPDDEAAVAADIEAARPDILLVAMSSPKKERFLARWSSRLGVPICHGVGGAFDILAGKVKRAPASWQRLGLEWLYRLKQEPRRLWRRYLVTNTLFCWMVVTELFRQLPSRLRREPVSCGR